MAFTFQEKKGTPRPGRGEMFPAGVERKGPSAQSELKARLLAAARRIDARSIYCRACNLRPHGNHGKPVLRKRRAGARLPRTASHSRSTSRSSAMLTSL